VLLRGDVLEDDVVAGRSLVLVEDDAGAADRHERGAAGGHDVLALVGVAGARGAEALPVAVGAGDREDVGAGRGRGGGRGRRGGRVAGGDGAAAPAEGGAGTEHDEERRGRNQQRRGPASDGVKVWLCAVV